MAVISLLLAVICVSFSALLVGVGFFLLYRQQAQKPVETHEALRAVLAVRGGGIVQTTSPAVHAEARVPIAGRGATLRLIRQDSDITELRVPLSGPVDPSALPAHQPLQARAALHGEVLQLTQAGWLETEAQLTAFLDDAERLCAAVSAEAPSEHRAAARARTPTTPIKSK